MALLCRFLEPYSTRDGWYSGYEKLLNISFLISANGSASHFTPYSEHNNLLTGNLAHITKAFRQLLKYYFFFSNICGVKKQYQLHFKLQEFRLRLEKKHRLKRHFTFLESLNVPRIQWHHLCPKHISHKFNWMLSPSNAHRDQTLRFLLRLTFHSQLKKWFQMLLQLNLTVFLPLSYKLLQLTWKLLHLQPRGIK